MKSKDFFHISHLFLVSYLELFGQYKSYQPYLDMILAAIFRASILSPEINKFLVLQKSILSLRFGRNVLAGISGLPASANALALPFHVKSYRSRRLSARSRNLLNLSRKVSSTLEKVISTFSGSSPPNTPHFVI